MVQLTKTKITELYNSNKSYEQICKELSSDELVITHKMIKELFTQFGLPSKKRAIKTNEKKSWYEIIDDFVEENVQDSVEV